MIELEVKARLTENAANNFFKCRPMFVSASTQVDLYYNAPTRDFKQTDEALRIRISDGQARLTYKGPKIDRETKARKEIELSIEDHEKLDEILQILSFKKIKAVTKVRTTYSLEGLCIMLDDVDDLGKFLEIEVLVEEELETVKKRIFSLLKKIGIEKHDLIRESYLELLLQKDVYGDDLAHST